MSIGIERNEKCLYAFDDRTKEEVLDGFKSRGFDVDKFIESGQFEFLTKNESYLKNGRFDPDKMISLLNDAKEDALEDGYDGLRATGEMTWFFSDMPGVERLMEYESKLNEFLPGSKVTALCQYNENKFPAEILVDVLRTHPKTLIYNDLHKNPYYMSPRIFKAKMDGEITWEHYESMKENIITRTRLKRKEEELKENLKEEHRQTKTLLSNLPGMAYRCLNNRNWTMKFLSEGCRALTGYDPEDLIEDEEVPYGEIIVPEDRESVWKEVQSALEKKEPFKITYRIETKGGEKKWVWEKGRGIFSESGELKFLEGFITDITERKNTKKELQKNKKRLHQIIQGSSVPIFVIDKDHRIAHWNRACEKLTGIPEEEIKGTKRQWEAFYDQERPVLADLILENASEEKIKEKYGKKCRKSSLIDGAYEGEDFFPQLDGKGKWIYFTAAPIKNPHGETVGAVETLQDITNRRETEERKEFLNTLIKKDLETKCQALMGYLQLLEESEIPGKHKEYLTKATELGREADEILELAKKLEEIEDTKLITEKNIKKVLEQAINNISGLSETEKVKIDSNFSDDVGPVKGDYSLTTLLSQILKTRIQTSECDMIKIDVRNVDGKMQLKVEDNGKKLVSDIQSIFSGDIYDGVTAGAGGARYYMIRELAEHNEAEIEVESSELGGPRFNIYLKKAVEKTA